MAEVLSPPEVDTQISERGLHWLHQGDALVKQVSRQDFNGALAYVNAVGALADAADHHPDVDIRWDTVILRLSTHSAGGITEKDLRLAGQVDELGD